jgi:hypothetical protein
MAFDATLGGSTANSYVELVYADDYFILSPYWEQWSAFSRTNREIALVQACSAMETIDYAGTRCSPSTDEATAPQALAWPRSGASCDGVSSSCTAIPKTVKDAQCLLALNLATSPDSINGPIGGGGGATQAGTYVSKNQLGDLVQEFSAYPSNDSGTDSCIDCSTPGVIATYPWLKGMLSCWAVIGSTSSKVLLRVRS